MAVNETKKQIRQISIQELHQLYVDAHAALKEKYGSSEAAKLAAAKLQDELVALITPVISRDDVTWALGFVAIFDMIGSAGSNFLEVEAASEKSPNILTPQGPGGDKWAN